MIKTVFHTLSIWIIIIPLLVSLMNRKELNRDSKWIFFLVLVALVPQLLTALLKKENPLLNFCYNFYTPIEFLVLYGVFYPKFFSVGGRFLLKITLGAYLLCCSYLFISFGLTSRFLNELVCVNNILYMLWILLLFKQEYAASVTIIEKSNPFTWYLIATIIYAPCTLVVFALYYYIRDPENPMLMNLWIIQSVSNILLYLLFSVGLLTSKTY